MTSVLTVNCRHKVRKHFSTLIAPFRATVRWSAERHVMVSFAYASRCTMIIVCTHDYFSMNLLN